MLGEHIRVLKGGRWIHAIDCGDETVLQLVESAPPPRVRRAYRPEFVAGAEVVEVVTHRERTFPAKEVVRRGYSRASDPALAAMFRDSEEFAEWCKTGRSSGSRNYAVDVPAATAAAPAPAKRAPAKRAPAKKAVKVQAGVKTKASAQRRPPKKAVKARAAPAKRKASARRAPTKTAQQRKAAKATRRTATKGRASRR